MKYLIQGIIKFNLEIVFIKSYENVEKIIIEISRVTRKQYQPIPHYTE